MALEREFCKWSFCAKPPVETIETDLLLVGGGMACTGAAVEAMAYAKGLGLKVTLVDKAALDRSGAVAMGLSAINTYVGPENKVADYVGMVRTDLMGIIREDLVYSLGCHVDQTVHDFQDWGLPIWQKDAENHTVDGQVARDEGLPLLKDGGKCVRSGRWQCMINGESYKVIVAEAAKNALGMENIYERVFIVKLLTDKNNSNRVCGAVGFSVREHKSYVFKCKAMIVACGGVVNVFRPRSVGEGQGRAWYPVWNAGSTYAMPAEIGAKMVLMENRFVPARFKDGYGPVGAWFLFFKAQATNAYGEDYMAKNWEQVKKEYPGYADAPGTCLRNHAAMMEMRAGRGPIMMHTDKAMQELAKVLSKKELKHLEAEAWEDFLDMSISAASLWASFNMEPDKVPSEIIPSEPYLLGSHAGCAGLWVSGPSKGYMGAPDSWFWGYDRMTTVEGLFTAGDGVGASGHKFSSGSHVEGRMAAKGAIAFILDHKDDKLEAAQNIDEVIAEIYLPFEIYEKYKDYTTAPEINPNYLLPKQVQTRLQKLMDEYVAGVTPMYQTNKIMLEEGLKRLTLLKEDATRLAARDLHELMRAWEQYHRILAGEAHLRHIHFREESRYPGYYYRADFLSIDDSKWKVFTISQYNKDTNDWKFETEPYKQLC
ncbi:MAG: adenylyl-sulfate reductase subunit alpha [Syntrophales bacterium]|nr:adenylyl-sulfate reductase subunit alpha [Syntrophales bacterium]MDD5640348.1 adenylyl-sulfate reductase subunit alpha [Syntrophales bacterium]